jgi:hypothetical protein
VLADIGLTRGDIERAVAYGRERKPASPATAVKAARAANDAATSRVAA